MRLISPGAGAVPATVNRYLLPSERQVIMVRQHPARVLPALTVAAGGLLAAEAVNGIAGSVKWARFAVWVLAGFLLVRAVVDVLAWYVQYIVVTNRRLILTSGILGRKVTVLPLQTLQNLAFTRSAGGRVLGYGAFSAEADGQAIPVIDYIPYPEQLYLEIYHLLYPPQEEAEDDPGDDGPGGVGAPDLDFDDL